MTAYATAPSPADLDAALLLVSRLGIDPADLARVAPDRPPAPTFAEYVPVVSAAVTAGTRRVYGSYWNRLTERWGCRRLDEPTPTEIKSLAEQNRTNVVVRRNARGGRSAADLNPDQCLIGPVRDRGEGDRAGQHRTHRHRQHAGQRVAHHTPIAGIGRRGQHGQLSQLLMVGDRSRCDGGDGPVRQ